MKAGKTSEVVYCIVLFSGNILRDPGLPVWTNSYEALTKTSKYYSIQNYRKCNNNYCSNTLLPLGEGRGDEVVRELSHFPSTMGAR